MNHHEHEHLGWFVSLSCLCFFWSNSIKRKYKKKEDKICLITWWLKRPSTRTKINGTGGKNTRRLFTPSGSTQVILVGGRRSEADRRISFPGCCNTFTGKPEAADDVSHPFGTTTISRRILRRRDLEASASPLPFYLRHIPRSSSSPSSPTLPTA